jgi:hypothetical protein
MKKLVLVLLALSSLAYGQTPVSTATVKTYWNQRLVPDTTKIGKTFNSYYNKVDNPGMDSGSVKFNPLSLGGVDKDTISANGTPVVIDGNVKIYDNSHHLLVDTYNKLFNDGGGNQSIDFGNKFLYDNGGVASVRYSDRELRDNSDVRSITWQSRIMQDGSSVQSIDWASRILKNAGGNTTLNWDSRTLFHGWKIDTLTINNLAGNGTGVVAVDNNGELSFSGSGGVYSEGAIFSIDTTKGALFYDTIHTTKQLVSVQFYANQYNAEEYSSGTSILNGGINSCTYMTGGVVPLFRMDNTVSILLQDVGGKYIFGTLAFVQPTYFVMSFNASLPLHGTSRTTVSWFAIEQ